MKYCGSKAKYAKYILPIILKNRKPGQFYVEPFVGGCNLIDKVTGNRIANDINPQIIDMFKDVSNGWTKIKDTITKGVYFYIKDNQHQFKSCLLGFVSIASSYGGTIWGSYAQGKTNKGISRNYVLESKNNLLKQKQGLIGIEFHSGDYRDLKIPANSIIYCDIPYEDTHQVYLHKNFNHSEFWNWANEMVRQGHKVFVSEYQAPADWKCVWEKKVSSSICCNKSTQSIEKLFTKDSKDEIDLVEMLFGGKDVNLNDVDENDDNLVRNLFG